MSQIFNKTHLLSLNNTVPAYVYCRLVMHMISCIILLKLFIFRNIYIHLIPIKPLYFQDKLLYSPIFLGEKFLYSYIFFVLCCLTPCAVFGHMEHDNRSNVALTELY